MDSQELHPYLPPPAIVSESVWRASRGILEVVYRLRRTITKGNQMKVLIEFVDKRLAIVLPVELAPMAADLLSRARVMERDYRESDPWTPSKGGAVVSFVQDDQFQPLSARELELQKKAETESSRWYTEYQAKTALDKRVKELESQLETLKSVTVCKTIEPELEPTEADYAAVVKDSDILF